jgi:hypothetical protein
MRFPSLASLALVVVVGFTAEAAPSTTLTSLSHEGGNVAQPYDFDSAERGSARTPFGFSLPYQADTEAFLFSW